MHLHIIQHVPFEGPGAIAEWAQVRGHSISRTEQWRDERLPSMEEFDLLVMMGGPMSANDDREFPWLAAEKRFITEAVEGRKAVLGVCLGAQLVANVLGARVYRNPEKEVGWFPVRLTHEAAKSQMFSGFPPTMTVLHWHGETFDLPVGAVRLAESEFCHNQAFEIGGRVLGLQFHMEVLPEGLESLIENCSADLMPGPAVQTAEEILRFAHLTQTLQPRLYSILDRMAEAARTDSAGGAA
ncbi:MAG TPA: type 1 glutamine amidotransferase [Terriglobia bacterium]|jgi:GMP synthase (glutamine-hydrolysing)|nr:type 1 glutamine amidotransferase [Terriglobia bacterium]